MEDCVEINIFIVERFCQYEKFQMFVLITTLWICCNNKSCYLNKTETFLRRQEKSKTQYSNFQKYLGGKDE